MQFIDEVTIAVSGGPGGDGIVAWRREKYVPKGGPAGGDGGRGGDVVLEATPELSTLIEFRYKKHFTAEPGKAGSISNRSGRSSEDLVIGVPVGTLAYRLEDEGRELLLADLSQPGERIRVAKGGRGGLGNQHFATSTRQAPRFAEKGEPAESATLRLELKLLADCGVIGLPNAGKSTLLSVASAARPKIADYPFTTLEPQLGVVRLAPDESFVMVDVPGLIEGAHAGSGLGDRFLRHIERTRVLIHLMDGARPADDILADKATIENELRLWNPTLLERPIVPVISKLDLPEARERFAELREQIPHLRGISAATGEGVRDLLYAAYRTIGETPLPDVAKPDVPRFVLTPHEPFAIEREPGGTFVVTGERVERLAAMTDFDTDEGLGRFEAILAKMGVDKKLRELGARDGDTVRIAGFEFDYS
ncbi:MAG: GTPase ObgE [Candidatus Eremiobacteraeota bacterium]|nr:GTPase ObgE [Candidatus Eremiobacteraeota bacterium]